MDSKAGKSEPDRMADRLDYRRYNRVFVSIVSAAVAFIVVLNFVTDPLLIFHKPWGKPLYSTNERARIPGFLHSLDYDTAIVGASTAMAVTSADAKELLNAKPVVLVMGGATIGEQSIVVEQGLGSGKLRRVIWLLDAVTFSFPTFRWDAPFPMELYKGTIANRLHYLFSSATLVSAFDVVGYWVTGKVPDGFVADLNGLYESFFPDQSGYSHDAVRVAFTSELTLQTLQDREVNFLVPYDPQNIEALFDKYIVDAALRNPNIEFEFVLSPTATAWLQFQKIHFPERLEQHFLIRKLAYEKISQLRNARLYDLQAEAAFVNDYRNFSDMLHYSRSIGRQLLIRIRHAQSDSARDFAATDARIRSDIERLPLP